MKLIESMVRVYKRDGFRWLLVRLFGKLLKQEMEIKRTKEKVWRILKKKYDRKVAHGTFKGMLLGEEVWWDPYSRINQVLGTYEAHVLKHLISFSDKGSSRFIDIGAADGYFAVGMAYSGVYDDVHAFEISEDGQRAIRQNSLSNGCSEKIQIFSEANTTSIANALADGKLASILIDIEGFEYKLLDDEMLGLLKNHFVICELHPWLIEKGYDMERSLAARALKYFNVDIIQRDDYNPNCFSELKDLTDEERLIAVGEGRHKNMSWMVLTPKPS